MRDEPTTQTPRADYTVRPRTSVFARSPRIGTPRRFVPPGPDPGQRHCCRLNIPRVSSETGRESALQPTRVDSIDCGPIPPLFRPESIQSTVVCYTPVLDQSRFNRLWSELPSFPTRVDSIDCGPVTVPHPTIDRSTQGVLYPRSELWFLQGLSICFIVRMSRGIPRCDRARSKRGHSCLIP